MSIVSVESLLNKRLHFYVPFYQRGYRWLDEEIKQLLVDMSTWPEQEDHPYFLQLLVVCKNNGKYNIVDGQQRLTTLSLILERIEGESVFDIDYARGYNECSADRRFRDHARNVIDNWLATESLEKKESLKKIILKATFLFHEVPQEEEAAMFQQLNTWRIPATDAELVKCIILSKGESTVLERRTEEWNIIENTLQDNFFWGMLGIKENSQSRMELFLSRYTLNDNSIRNSCHKFPLFDKVQNLSAEEIVLWWNDLLEKWRIFRRYYGNPLY